MLNFIPRYTADLPQAITCPHVLVLWPKTLGIFFCIWSDSACKDKWKQTFTYDSKSRETGFSGISPNLSGISPNHSGISPNLSKYFLSKNKTARGTQTSLPFQFIHVYAESNPNYLMGQLHGTVKHDLLLFACCFGSLTSKQQAKYI